LSYNGPAFKGYTGNGITNTPCNNGNYQPAGYQTACITCLEGYYCPNTGTLGISEVDSYECSGGTLCGPGMATDTGTACSVNKFCPVAAQIEFPCPDGYQQNLPGKDSCDECGAGFYCYQTFAPDPATGFGTTTYTQNVIGCSVNNLECTGELN